MIPQSQLALITGTAGPGVIRSIEWMEENIGACEVPPGSNRGPEIDEWAKELGSPLGSYWCALAVGKARKVGGLWIPTHDVGSCDEWYLQAEQAGKIIPKPVHGAAVIYTNGQTLKGGRYHGRKDANHIGLVNRVAPVLLDFEGNTTIGKYDRNGFIMTMKQVAVERVLCYVAP